MLLKWGKQEKLVMTHRMEKVSQNELKIAGRAML